jgi:YD repeat-containing protein
VEQILLTNSGSLRMTVKKGYDNLNRLTGITNLNPSSVVLDKHTYAYNSANQRTAVTQADNSVWSYGYDSLGQVTSGKRYWSDSAPAAGQQFTYAFDDIGNRTQAQFGGNDLGVGLRTAMSSEKLARELALEAGGGMTPIKEFDEQAQRWHYHLGDRSGGHIFYGAAGALTFAYYAKGQGGLAEGAAEVGDFFNPLSLPKDLLDIYDMINDAFNCTPIDETPVHAFRGSRGEFYVGRRPPRNYRFLW